MAKIATRTRLFLWLSLFLAVSDGLFVWINYENARRELALLLEERGQDMARLFDTQLHSTAVHMQQTATYIANEPEVQRLFLAGRRAAEAEGGGGGGPHTRRIRQALLDHIAPPWHRLNADYDTRQLHFQYGEQATSFLRVHSPERYGDPLEDVRFIIIDAIRKRQPTLGFETGRAVSGIRGVVPVETLDPATGKPTFVGVLEAGTSFQTLLKTLEGSSHARFAVLLRRSYVDGVYWPDKLKQYQARNPTVGDHYVEALLRPEDVAFLRASFVGTLIDRFGTDWGRYESRPFAVTAIPLRDYRGNQDPAREAIGTVVAWHDISEVITQSETNLRVNLAYALGGFVVVEVLLFLALRAATRRMEEVIADQTRALRELAIRDELTGLFNRQYLHEVLGSLQAHARRKLEPLTLVMMDLDHFKQINDQHGHLVGDQVLRMVAALVRKRLRAADLAFRYGGEELLIVLPDTSIEAASQVCEEIRDLIATAAIEPLLAGALTASFGVCTVGQDLGEALKNADDALYQAKTNGRNRVELFARQA